MYVDGRISVRIVATTLCFGNWRVTETSELCKVAGILNRLDAESYIMFL